MFSLRNTLDLVFFRESILKQKQKKTRAERLIWGTRVSNPQKITQASHHRTFCCVCSNWSGNNVDNFVGRGGSAEVLHFHAVQ